MEIVAVSVRVEVNVQASMVSVDASMELFTATATTDNVTREIAIQAPIVKNQSAKAVICPKILIPTCSVRSYCFCGCQSI